MSESAGQQLLELGYTKVYDLKGGMIAWKESGREVIHKI
jgi:rhodanese-related sulfurtransferase